MIDTIYDFRVFAGPSLAPRVARPPVWRGWLGTAPAHPGLTGVIVNPRSRRHLAGSPEQPRRDVISAAPRTRAEIEGVLVEFAEQGIDLLVIDGGDGTVRDVLTCAGTIWGDAWPRIAVLPSGKTNALATDLGIPAGWTLDDAMAAARGGRIVRRSPIEIERSGAGGLAVRGFLFGAGAFVDATALAQRTHRAGAFDGVAVAMALGWGVLQTLFGGGAGRWRGGTRMKVEYGAGARRMHGTMPPSDDRRYILLASTFERLPVGLRPFGRRRAGLKTLLVDAPPRRLAWHLPALLAGSESPRLEQAGYHRIDADRLEVTLDSSFILDGERFPPGRYVLRRARALPFVAP